jgi:hypothetical protein
MKTILAILKNMVAEICRQPVWSILSIVHQIQFAEKNVKKLENQYSKTCTKP